MVGRLSLYLKGVHSLGDEDVRISKRAYVPYSRLRGFEKNKIGPIDNEDYIGGNYVSTLNFSTNLLLQSVLGFDTGNYDVKITYGDNSIITNFTVDSQSSSTDDGTQLDSEFLEIFTEKESYIPGETVILFADTNSAIEYGGL